MKIVKTALKGVYVLSPKVFEDQRGFFMESYSKKTFQELGFDYNFVQDNQSFNKKKYTFRGLHYQLYPKAQTTYLRVISGAILDIVLDIRKGSPTFGKIFSTKISANNKKQLLISKGFAHGFLTLSDDVNILYKMDEFYAPQYDRVINFQDKKIGLDLGIDLNKLIIAEKDKLAPNLEDAEINFVYKMNC